MTAETTIEESAPPAAETLGARISRLAHKLNRPSRLTIMSYALCAPLIAVLALFFLLPLVYVLHSALHNPVIGGAWPEFVQALRDDHEEVPGEAVFRALVHEFQREQKGEAYKLTLKPFSQQNPQLWRLLQQTADTLPPESFSSAKSARARARSRSG